MSFVNNMDIWPAMDAVLYVAESGSLPPLALRLLPEDGRIVTFNDLSLAAGLYVSWRHWTMFS
jgi:hypothetical protein